MIALDTTVSGGGNGSNSVALPALSTSGTNRLILVDIHYTNDTEAIASLTAAGLTFVRVLRLSLGTGGGFHEVWRAFATAQLSAVVITVNFANGTFPQSSAVVGTYSGTDTTGTNGSGAIGATGSAANTGGRCRVTVATTRPNSLLHASLSQLNNSAINPGRGITVAGTGTSSPGTASKTVHARASATAPVRGTRLSSYFENTSGVKSAFSAVEILEPVGAANPTGTQPSFGLWPGSGSASAALALQTSLRRPVIYILDYFQWNSPNVAGAPNNPVGSWIDTDISSGLIPVLTWEPWQETLDDIAAGVYDAFIDSWADTLSTKGTIYLRPMHEMNGSWYPWGATGTNTPTKYVNAWRHLHDRFVARGATNVKWVWAPNTKWVGGGDFDTYYPGSLYVDVLALDGYNQGLLDSGSPGWPTFWDVFREAYDDIAALDASKPIWIAEVGVAGETGSEPNAGDKAAWITDMWSVIAPTFPRISALIWFSENKVSAGEHDYRADQTAATTAAFALPRTVSDTGASISDTLIRNVTRRFADTGATISESIARIKRNVRLPTDTLVFSSSLFAHAIQPFRSVLDQGAQISDSPAAFAVGRIGADTYADGPSQQFGPAISSMYVLSIFTDIVPPYSPPEPEREVYFARLPFHEAQAKFGETVPTPRSSVNTKCAWHGLLIDSERGSFAVVRAGGSLEGLIGQRVRITKRGSAGLVFVLAYVHGSADLHEGDEISVSRRLFLALSIPGNDRVPVTVERLQ